MHRKKPSLAATLLFLTLSGSAVAQEAQVLVDCNPGSTVLQRATTLGCHTMTSRRGSFLKLPPGVFAVLFPTGDCSGPVRLLASDAGTDFCRVRYPNDFGVNDNVGSLQLVRAIDPALLSSLNGTYKGPGDATLSLTVRLDGRLFGTARARWGGNQSPIEVPVHGLAIWAENALTNDPLNALDPLQPTEDVFLSLSVCLDARAPGFTSPPFCQSWSGAAEVEVRRAPVKTLTLQRAAVTGNQRGFTTSGGTEVFTRTN